MQDELQKGPYSETVAVPFELLRKVATFLDEREAEMRLNPADEDNDAVRCAYEDARYLSEKIKAILLQDIQDARNVGSHAS